LTQFWTDVSRASQSSGSLYRAEIAIVSRAEPPVCAPIDANGNLTSDGTKTYVWNALNQLVEVKEGTTTIATFEYDGAGRRTEKV